jgi:hypothetical protein
MDAPRVAFLSQDAVFVAEPGRPPRRLESAFAEGVRERARRIAQGQGWKSESTGGFLSGAALWGAGAPDPGAIQVSIRGLGAGCAGGELVYCLDTGPVAGAFRYDLASGEEQRLFHGNHHALEHVAAEPGGERLACSVRGADGTSDIALFGADGALPRAVTGGDSLDQAPSFVPGRPALVFQSAGLGRDRAGNPVGHGPFCVHELDLETGELRVCAEDARFDFLSPRVDAAGTLYSLRRPYEPAFRVSRWRALKDVLLFPFRVLRGVFGWLYHFTFLYSGRRLTSAGAPPWKTPELRQLVLWGRAIDAEKAARRARLRGDDAPALVPSSWQLVRHGAGEPEVIARHALAFDLAPDGSALVSNGSAIDRIGRDGRRERVCKAPSIEQVVALA